MSVLEPVERWPGRRGPTMRPPSRVRTRIAAAVAAGAVGLLVGIQAGEGGDDRIDRLAQERPEDLTRILGDLNAEADRLARQVSELRLRVLRYRNAASGSDVALRDARRTLRDLEVLSGAVAVEGPGATVTVSDPEVAVGWDVMLDLIQELRDAGAEALALDGHRVVASTWLGPGVEGLVIDGRTVLPPYEIRAIGPASSIREALELPGGPVTVIRAETAAAVEIEESEALMLPPLRRETRFEYARPIP
jgi:uncharacterized protein YlxW (UPF0749 family)